MLSPYFYIFATKFYIIHKNCAGIVVAFVILYNMVKYLYLEENDMKKVIVTMLALAMCLSLVACGNDEKQTESELESEKPQSAEPATNQEETAKSDDETVTSKELTYDDEFEFDGYTVVFSPNYSFDKVSNQYSDLNNSDVVVFTLTVTNNNTETGMINPFYISLFGTSGSELDDCSAYFDNDLLFGTGKIRSGATADATLHALYDGDGDYYVEFDNFSEKVEVKLPVVKQ